MTEKQTINLREPEGVWPTLPEAREAMEEAKRALDNAEGRYGPVEKAMNSPDPAPGDLRSLCVWEVDEHPRGGHHRSLTPGAAEAVQRLHQARDAFTEAAATFKEVKEATEAALASQTERYVVPPGRRFWVSGGTGLRAGQEARSRMSYCSRTDLERLVAAGLILEKPNWDKRYIVGAEKSVVTKHGLRKENEPVWIEDLDGGDTTPKKRLERLIRQGILVKPEDTEEGA